MSSTRWIAEHFGTFGDRNLESTVMGRIPVTRSESFTKIGQSGLSEKKH
jgi:hypothetical protein